MYECLVCIYVCALCEYRACRGQKKVLGLLELDIRRVVSCHVGAENRTLSRRDNH